MLAISQLLKEIASVLWLVFGSAGFIVALLYGLDNLRDIPAVRDDPTQKGYAIGRTVFSGMVLIVEAIFVAVGLLAVIAPGEFGRTLIWALVSVPIVMFAVIVFLYANKIRLRRRVAEG